MGSRCLGGRPPAMACPHIKPEYPGGAESPSSPAWHEFPLLKGIGREYRQLSSTSAQIHSVDAARRPLRAFPAKAGIHCVPRMALNLEVQVLFGPQGAEPIAKGNCVAAMRGGEEAGGKSGGRRTEIGYKASAVGQPGDGRGRPILLPSRARVNPAVTPRKCSVLPWEASSALRTTGAGCRRRHPMVAEESAEAIVAPDR